MTASPTGLVSSTGRYTSVDQIYQQVRQKQEKPKPKNKPESEDSADDERVVVKPLDYHFLLLARDGNFKEAVKLANKAPASKFELDKDEFYRTAAHYAGMSAEGEPLLNELIKKVGTYCLTQKDCDSATPLHFAAESYSLEQFRNLIPGAEEELQSPRLQDDFGDTLAHYAAWNTQDDGVIKTVIDKNRTDRLLWRNNRNQTVLHVAVEHCNAKTVEYLLKQSRLYFTPARLRDEDEVESPLNAKDVTANEKTEKEKAKQQAIEKMKNLEDQDKNTLAHCAARNHSLDSPDSPDNKHDDEVFYVAQELFGDDSLSWKNSKSQSVLQTVIKHCTDTTAKQMVKILAGKNIPGFTDHADDSGNTYLHSAAMYKKIKTFAKIKELMRTKLPGDEYISHLYERKNNEGQTVLHLAADNEKLGQILTKNAGHLDWKKVISYSDKSGRNIIFYACMGWSFSVLKNIPKQYGDEPYTQLDSDNNSLVHAMFLNHKADTVMSLEFFEALRLLTRKMKYDIKQENSFGKNFLHCCQLKQNVLKQILCDAEKEKDIKSMFKDLFRSKEGIHVVHEFACRYELRVLIRPLAQIAAVMKFELRRLKVERGPNKNANCLHFACQAGHQLNIVYLKKKKFNIADKDHENLTCIDYARNADQLESILEVERVDSEEALRLIDPSHRALKLPDRASAMQVITRIVEQPVKEKLERGHSRFKKRASGDQMLKEQDISTKKPTLGVRVLLAAWELDSPKVYKSALTLDLLGQETEAKFIEHWLSEYPGAVHLKYRKSDRKNQTETKLIDLAFDCNKLNLLPDIIITRQFELIPVCIRLVIQLKQNLSKHDCHHDQLKTLKSKVISIAVNTLDLLYANADDEERKLLFQYIRGELGGPRFSIGDTEANSVGTCCTCTCCNGDSLQQHTVLELVELAGCADLYATDCIYKLAEEEWNKRLKVCGTPRLHFGLGLATYIIFMFYLAWFVTDFKTTFQSPACDAILTAFAVLFLVLEVADFISLPARKICCGSGQSKCSMHWRNVYNVFDFIALLLLWLGVIWKWVIVGKADDVTSYACQSILSTSFLVWGFRSVSFLSAWKKTGPVIVMLRKLIISDLLPFLAIIAIIFLSFGVFFFNLLFPSTTAQSTETGAQFYWWRVLLQIFTLPFDLLFTNFDRIEFDTPIANSDQNVGSVANAIGLSWFRNLTLFIFLLLVNIVMVNLLIARFSLRVSTLHSKADLIWRRGYFELLREYQNRADLCLCRCWNTIAPEYEDEVLENVNEMGSPLNLPMEVLRRDLSWTFCISSGLSVWIT